MEQLLQRVVRLGAPAQCLGERRRADRHDHELLHVDGVVGVDAAVDDVHHRHRQHVRVRRRRRSGTAEARARRRRPWRPPGWCRGSRWRRAEPCCRCRRARSARDRLVRCSRASKPSSTRGDLAVDEADGGEHTLAEVAVAAVTQLDRFVLAGGRAARHRGAAAWRRCRARLRPRRSGCRASRGSRGRRCERCRS